METTSLPVSWLNTDSPLGTTTAPATTLVGDTTNASGSWYTYPIYPILEPTYRYYHDYSWWTKIEKIRLTMTDVEKLRAAAKKDKTLKKVLEKIGPHIEVEVDFG